jgi:cytochrome c-type biogenesis protein CcmH
VRSAEASAALFCIAMLAGPGIHAAASDTAIERRVQRITEELRCVVCQNQTIADSHAELALSLKQQVRDMLAQGMSDAQATDFMVQRYGDFVLYRPPLKHTTWLLWFGPFLLLLSGLVFLLLKLRAARAASDEEATSGAVQ